MSDFNDQEREEPKPMTGLPLAIRIAKGGPLSTDSSSQREAFRLGYRKHLERVCIGFGEFDGACGDHPDLKLNPSALWCTRCERLRREAITRSLEQIKADFERKES
jgi:hypothetical protein